MSTTLPSVTDFRFSHPMRVRWVEVDMQKIVFNGHYLMYFDTAVAEYWRALALPYEQTMHELHGDLYVVKATVEYKASAKYDDRLRVCLRCDRVGNSSITFKGAIFCDGKLLVTGELIYVYANPQTQTSQPLPTALRDLFGQFESGEPMSAMEQGNWQYVGQHGLTLRNQVFVAEQGVPAELEHDALDATAHHALIRNRMGLVIAAGRLLQPETATGQIGRMAVNRVLRGSDLGRRVLQALVDASRARGDDQVILHAQVTAIDFYAKSGFKPHGEVFEEAGMAHQEMRLQHGA